MEDWSLKDVWQREVEARGALDVDLRDGAVSPRRLPAWTRLQVPALMDVIVRMPSGVRLRFATDSPRVGISFHATNLVTPPQNRRPVAFDLETGDSLRHATSTAGNTIFLNPSRPGEFRLECGDGDTIWFDDLPAHVKVCELWLPHNAFVSLATLHLEDGAVLHAPPADDRVRWIHYGSSISHCMEADAPALTWPAVAARLAGVNLQSLGFGGQCHLDQFVARTIRDSDADVISIKTGINVINMDSMRERVFESALHGFLDTIREGKPLAPIQLVSPIFCPSAEDHPGPTVPDASGRFVTIPGSPEIRAGCMTLTGARRIIERVVAARREAGDANLYYLSGLELFGESDAQDLPDDLHPNPAGYVRMGERFAPSLSRLIESLPTIRAQAEQLGHQSSPMARGLPGSGANEPPESGGD